MGAGEGWRQINPLPGGVHDPLDVAETTTQIYRWAYRFLQNHDDALDVTQGVLVRQLRAGRLEAEGQWGWLRRVTFNLCVDTLRRRRPTTADAEISTITSPSGPAEQSERHTRIVEALDALTDAQRHVLMAKVFDGFSFAKIADDAGLSVNSVKTHYLRALHKLRGQLKDA